MYRFSYYLIAFTLAISFAGIRNASATSLSKEQALVMALSRNKSLEAARMTIEQAEADWEHEGTWDDPELLIDYSNDWLFNNEGESAFGIGFRQRFPVTNRLRLIKDIAGVEIDLARSEVWNAERLLLREVEIALNDWAHLQAQLDLRKELLDLNASFAAFVESRIERAEASPLDANRIKIERYAIEQEVERLENRRAIKLSEIRRLVGIELGETLEIEYSLGDLGQSPSLPILDDAALSDHPQFLMSQLLIEIAETETELAHVSRWRDISVDVGFESERSMDAPLGIDSSRFFGVSVVIPLPLRHKHEPIERERLSKLAQRRVESDALSLVLRTEADSLRQQAESLFAQASRYEGTMTDLMDQAHEEMEAAYAAGQVSLSEVFRSQEQRLEIQSKRLEMIHEYRQALVEWSAATGRNLPNIKTLSDR